MATSHKCIICGKSVTAEDGVALAAFGRPISVRGRMVVYHAGSCSELAHEAIGLIGKGALSLVRARAPKLIKFARDAIGVLRGAS